MELNEFLLTPKDPFLNSAWINSESFGDRLNSYRKPSRIIGAVSVAAETDSTKEDENDKYWADPMCIDDWTLTISDEEACKREKDWTERRKYGEVNENITELEDDLLLTSTEMQNRYESFYTCWNDCSPLHFCNEAYEECNGHKRCCDDYPLHKIFMRKESLNRMWDSSDCKSDKNTSKNCSTNENHVRSRSIPTPVKQKITQCRSPSQRYAPKRSVLKSQVDLVSTTIRSAVHSLGNPLMNTPSNNSRQESTRILVKNLESDGDSPRSLSPQSSVADEDDLIFRTNQIDAEKLSDYISEGAASASRDTPTSDRRSYIRRKEEESQRQTMESDIKRNTLSDHCYHQSRSMERLTSETFSETDEEEIDVVSYEKKGTYYNFAQKQHDANQLAMNYAQKQHSVSHQLTLNITQKQQNANQLAANIDKTPVRRPRGRPPGPNSAKRKRAAQIDPNETSGPAPKRARVQTNQRGQKRQKYAKHWRAQTSEEEDDEEDSAKRNLHNNMERQRRISMKNFFDALKQHVPTIANKERVAKVTILNQAKTHISALKDEDNAGLSRIKQLKRQNQILQKRFEELRREQSRMLRLQRRY
ncbi:n-myc protein [Lasius niger]|uniref:N-myc protein n=1 Tax=Lasius niger TaxID=67767 RepID=A0A0J7L9H8_LASNI|nr:n-myc protein [Lasius niger]